MRKRHALAAAIVAGGLTLTACSHSGAPPATQATAPVTGAATPHVTQPAIASEMQPAIASQMQPATADAAKATARQFFNSYSNGQYAFAWALLDPSDQQAIPQATWVAVHDGCPGAVAGLAYRISNVTVTGSTAVVTYTLSLGTHSNLGSGAQTFTYSKSHWRLALSDPHVYQHGSVKADIAAAKRHRNCL
jgi:hypothetical protein